MTMLSFRVAPEEADAARAWADRLGIDRSQLLRDALRTHLARLGAERDLDAWLATPLDDREQAMAEIADWGPAEDWADWAGAERGDASR